MDQESRLDSQNRVLDTTLAGFFAQFAEISAAYLFGSQAKGTATAESDVDVAVLLDPDFDLETHFAYRLEQMAALEGVYHCPVDVVILNSAPLMLRNQVLKYGRRVYEKDRRQRIAFEAQSLLAYYDFRPTLDYLHDALTRQIREVGLVTRYRSHRDPLGDARRARERYESLAGHQL